uniref:Uncharacterized protein n=1 Tax=Romanomermis culicivorax TaxID=13658 RepID=A0A915ITG1_ROMCU
MINNVTLSKNLTTSGCVIDITRQDSRYDQVDLLNNFLSNDKKYNPDVPQEHDKQMGPGKKYNANANNKQLAYMATSLFQVASARRKKDLSTMQTYFLLSNFVLHSKTYLRINKSIAFKCQDF